MQSQLVPLSDTHTCTHPDARTPTPIRTLSRTNHVVFLSGPTGARAAVGEQRRPGGGHGHAGHGLPLPQRPGDSRGAAAAAADAGGWGGCFFEVENASGKRAAPAESNSLPRVLGSLILQVLLRAWAPPPLSRRRIIPPPHVGSAPPQDLKGRCYSIVNKLLQLHPSHDEEVIAGGAG